MKKALASFALSFFLSGCSFLFPNGTDGEKKSMDLKEMVQSQIGVLDNTPVEKDGMKKRVWVLPFLNHGRHGGDELATHARDIVHNALIGAKEFNVIPMKEIDGTERLTNDLNEYDLRPIYDKARAFGVSGIVGGTIEDVVIRETGDETGVFRTRQFAVVATIRLKLFDAATERELMSKVTSADVTEERTEFFRSREITNYDPERGKVAVRKALEKIVGIIPAYAKKIAWHGRIAKVDMHRYYITAGEMSGIGKHQLLKVFEEGQPVYDPDTKQLVGVAPGRFKGLLKVVDHFGEDGSVAILHSGGGFREKDRVEIFSQLRNR